MVDSVCAMTVFVLVHRRLDSKMWPTILLEPLSLSLSLIPNASKPPQNAYHVSWKLSAIISDKLRQNSLKTVLFFSLCFIFITHFNKFTVHCFCCDTVSQSPCRTRSRYFHVCCGKQFSGLSLFVFCKTFFVVVDTFICYVSLLNIFSLLVYAVLLHHYYFPSTLFFRCFC